jgi:pimeloyl-ACP methyl ester carboxylesterase
MDLLYNNKLTALNRFRAIPEKSCGEWRYRVFGPGPRTILLIPGGELVNDFGFEFALAMSEDHRMIYPAYPHVSSIEELADGLHTILDAEGIDQVSILGASFGGSVAQVFVRRHPDRVSELILSNTGVPLQQLARPVRLTYWVAKAIPWKLISKLLKKPLLKTVSQSALEREFWMGYLDELFSRRLTKADILANMLIQYEYHSRFHFTPEDLGTWNGRVLIAESDTDIIGPRRRQALRESYPGAKVHTFYKAGHAPMFTQPGEYLKVVKDFLEITPARLQSLK